MNKTYVVIFKENGKKYFFFSEENYKENDYVIVETEKGLQYGKIINVLNKPHDENLRKILRLADENDYKTHLKNLKDASTALKKATNIVHELKLPMSIVSASFTFDRNQLLFNFVSDDRVDFRELAKKLAYIYHTRIELRQIGARDKAKEIGGLGICGKRLCCNNFLNQIEAVSMNMAKNQNLALNPSKINGLCGRLLCCLAYEDANYTACSKNLPRVGSEIKINDKKGIVHSVDILNRKITIIVNGEKEELNLDENDQK